MPSFIHSIKHQNNNTFVTIIITRAWPPIWAYLQETPPVPLSVGLPLQAASLAPPPPRPSFPQKFREQVCRDLPQLMDSPFTAGATILAELMEADPGLAERGIQKSWTSVDKPVQHRPS